MKDLHLVLFLVAFGITTSAQAVSLYDCSSPRPEAPGFHNMVLFGSARGGHYAYHLPLFAGGVNGRSGHVLMHVYQAIWRIRLDEATAKAYARKLAQERINGRTWPFFTFAPIGERFRLPQMICEEGFTVRANAVSGHVEGHPEFPAPVPLWAGESIVMKEATIFARRFDESSKEALTYILFGRDDEYYLVHYLTDDENSFDQIVAVKGVPESIQAKVAAEGALLVAVPLAPENDLAPIGGAVLLRSPNNKRKLPSGAEGVAIRAVSAKGGEGFSLIAHEEIYFNRNEDLQKQR